MSDAIGAGGDVRREDFIADIKSTYALLLSGEGFDYRPVIALFRIAGALSLMLGSALVGIVFFQGLSFHNAGVGIGFLLTGANAIAASIIVRKQQP